MGQAACSPGPLPTSVSLADPWDDTAAPSNQLLTTIANAVGARNADGSAITNFGNAPTGKPGEFDALKA